MSAPTRIIRATDKQLIDTANSLADQLSVNSYHVFYSGNATQSYDELIDKDDFEDRSYSIVRLEILFSDNRLRVVIARGQYVPNSNAMDVNQFRTSRCSANFDEYWVVGNQPVSVSQSRAIDHAFAKHQSLPVESDANESNIVALLASHVEQLRELELAFHDKQLAADEELRARRVASEKEFEERVEVERKALQEKQDELEAFRKEINDREPQHERRRLRESLTSDLQDYLDRPDAPSFGRRNLVHGLYLIAGMLFLSISVGLTMRIDLATEVGAAGLWINSVKSLASGIGGAGFLWAGLSGLKAASVAQTAYSQKIQKYSFDMDRASWIVETALHMNSTESAQIPDKWLEAVCQDLFGNQGQPDQDARSLDALAALLDATAKAKLGSSGFEFEIDKKAARKMAEGS